MVSVYDPSALAGTDGLDALFRKLSVNIDVHGAAFHFAPDPSLNRFLIAATQATHGITEPLFWIAYAA